MKKKIRKRILQLEVTNTFHCPSCHKMMGIVDMGVKEKGDYIIWWKPLVKKKQKEFWGETK